MDYFESPVERKYEYISVDPASKQELFAASIQQGEQECMQVHITERPYPFAFLKEGAFAVRLESFIDQPIIAKVEVDGVLSRANHRILPLSVAIIRDIRVSAGQTAEPLFYACREEHNPRTVQLNSMAEVDSYTGLLRILLFSVRITGKGAWSIDNLEPIGVILLKCGHHKPLRIFFGLTVDQVKSRPRQKFRSRSRSRSAQGNRARDVSQLGMYVDPTAVHAKTARHSSQRRSSPAYSRYASTGKISNTAHDGIVNKPPKRSVVRPANHDPARDTSPTKANINRSNSRSKGSRVNSLRPTKGKRGSEENPPNREVEPYADKNARGRRPRLGSNMGAQKQITANPRDSKVENVSAPIVEGEWKITPPPSPLAEGAVDPHATKSALDPRSRATADDATHPPRSASITRVHDVPSHPIDVSTALTGVTDVRASQRSSSGRRGSTPQDDGLVRYIEESFSRSGSRLPSPSVTSMAPDSHASHNVRDSLNAFAPGSGGGGGGGGGSYSASGLGGVRGSVSEDPFAQPYRAFAAQALHPTLRHSVDTQSGYPGRTLSPQAVAPSAMRDSVTIERAGSGNDGRELVRYSSQHSTALAPGEHRRSGSRYTLCVKCESVFGRERRMYEDLIEELRLQLMHTRAEKEELELRLQEVLAEASGAPEPGVKSYGDHNNRRGGGGGGGGGDDADYGDGYGNNNNNNNGGGNSHGGGGRNHFQPRRGSGGNGSYDGGAGGGGEPRGRTRNAGRGGGSNDVAAEDTKEHPRERKISFKEGGPDGCSSAAVRPAVDSVLSVEPTPKPPVSSQQVSSAPQVRGRELERKPRNASPIQGRGVVAQASQKSTTRAVQDAVEKAQTTDSLGRPLNLSESISVSEGTCTSMYDDDENLILTGSLLTVGTIDDVQKIAQPPTDESRVSDNRLERKLSGSDMSVNGNPVPMLPIQQAPTVLATRRTQKPTIDNRRTPKKEEKTIDQMIDDVDAGFGLRTLKPSEQQHTMVWSEGERNEDDEVGFASAADGAMEPLGAEDALAHTATQSSLHTLQHDNESQHDETSWSPTPRSMDETIRPRRRTWSGGTMSDGREGSDRVGFAVDRLAFDWDAKDDDVKSPKHIVLTGRPSRMAGRHHSVGGTAFPRGGSYGDHHSMNSSHHTSEEFDHLDSTCAPRPDTKVVTSSQESGGSSSTGQLTDRVKEVIVVQDLKGLDEDVDTPNFNMVSTACFVDSGERNPPGDHLRVSKCLEYTSDTDSTESGVRGDCDDDSRGSYSNTRQRRFEGDAVDDNDAADDDDERCSFQIFRGTDSTRETPTASFAGPSAMPSTAARDAQGRTRATPLSSREAQRKNSAPGPASGAYNYPAARVQRLGSFKVGDPLTLYRPGAGDETPTNYGSSGAGVRKQSRYDRFYHPSAAPTPTMCATPEADGEYLVTPSDSYAPEFYEDHLINRRMRDADTGYITAPLNTNIHRPHNTASRNRSTVQRSFNESWSDDPDEERSFSGSIQHSAASPTNRQVYNEPLGDGDCSTDGVTPNSSCDDHPKRDPHRRHANIPPNGKRTTLRQPRAAGDEEAGINSIDPNVSTSALSNGTNRSSPTTCTSSVSASGSSFGMMGSAADTKGVHAAGHPHENSAGAHRMPSARVRVKHAPIYSHEKTEEEQKLEDDLAYQYYLESRNSSMLQDETEASIA